jgi:nucleotide-binding universal stress UspA family protein
MPFKDILLALTTYPDRTPDSSVADAVAIAATFGARLAAIACEAKTQLPNTLLGNALIDLQGIAAAEAKKSAENAARLLAAFDAETRKQGVASETISESCFTGEVPEIFVEHARLRDLTILPVPQGAAFDQWYAESIIFGSGRPTLVIPYEWKRRVPFRIDTAVVAWDFSRAAARTVADAIPALQKAKRVYVLTVTNEKEFDTRRSASELAKHLTHHGVEVIVDAVDAADREVGTVIKSYCMTRDADLLVMGAYGHSRIREFILGGATNSLLSQPPLPILMSH